MDLTLKITSKETNMANLVKQMCALQCRVKVDTVEGLISILGIDDDEVGNVVDIISKIFDISGIDMIPSAQIPENVVTQESFEIEKIEFKNADIEEQLNKLMRLIYWLVYSKHANVSTMCNHLKSARAEITMKYNPKELIDFSIGDIVACNFGSNPYGEVSGGFVHAVVCEKDQNEMVYVVPISKEKYEMKLPEYLPLRADIDADYINGKYKGGTVLLRKGKFISSQRIQSVVGTARSGFFKTLLNTLPSVISFSFDNYATLSDERFRNVDNDDNLLPVEEIREIQENIPDSFDITDYVSDVVKLLDNTKPLEEQIEMFLNIIGLGRGNDVIKAAFEEACKMDKITYAYIVPEVAKNVGIENDKLVENTLKSEFKKWLENYPKLKERYPKISMINLLKLFAKKMK